MNINQFQNELRSIIKNQYSSLRTDSINLLLWFLEYGFDLDKDLAISLVCDGRNDKGIDGLYVDTIEEIIYVLQSKIKDNNDRQIGDRVLRDFSGVRNWFKNSDTVKTLKDSTINIELKSLLSELRIEELINDYEVEYHLVINAFSNTDTEEYLKVNTDIQIWDIEALKKFHHLTKDDPLVMEKHSFYNIPDEELILSEMKNNIKTAIAPISATEILKLTGIDDLTLFNKNVRYGLGNTRVNKSIKKTLQNSEERENFLLFHNGISMVCEKFDYDENTEQLNVENYSIVNGAQSILSFYNNDKLLDDNIKILVRITEVGSNLDLTKLISRYNNNQNSISMKDLRSNDKVQNRLIREFEDLNKNMGIKVIYTSKRGVVIENGYRELPSDYCGQLIESCYLFRPHYTHLKTAMFDSRYNEVFNKNSTSIKLLSYFNAHQMLKKVIKKIEDKGIADYGLAQYFLLMCLFKLLNSDNEIQKIVKDENVYINNIDIFNELYEKLLSIIIKVFNKEIRENKKDELFVYKNFFKSKESIEKTYENIKALFDSLLELDSTDLKSIITDIGLKV